MIKKIFLFGLFCLATVPNVANAMTIPSLEVSNVETASTNLNAGDEISGNFTLSNFSSDGASDLWFSVGLAYVDETTKDTYILSKQDFGSRFSLDAKSSKTIPFNFLVPSTIPESKVSLAVTVYYGLDYLSGFGSKEVLVQGAVAPISVSNGAIKLSNGKEFGLMEGPTIYSKADSKNNDYANSADVVVSLTSNEDTVLNPKVEIYAWPDNLVLSSSVLSDVSVKLEKDKSKEVSIHLPDFGYNPGVYDGRLTFVGSDLKEKTLGVKFKYIISGNIASINSISSEKTTVTKNEKVDVVVDFGGVPVDIANQENQNKIFSDHVIDVVLKNELNQKIGEKQLIVPARNTGPEIITIDATKSAKAILAEVLITSDEKILASKTTYLSSDYDSVRKKALLFRTLKIVCVIVLIIFVAILSMKFMKRRGGLGLAILFALSVLPLQSFASEVVYNTKVQTDPKGCPDPGLTVSYTGNGISDNKEFSPGETFTIDGQVTYKSCSNAAVGTNVAGYIIKKSDAFSFPNQNKNTQYGTLNSLVATYFYSTGLIAPNGIPDFNNWKFTYAIPVNSSSPTYRPSNSDWRNLYRYKLRPSFDDMVLPSKQISSVKNVVWDDISSGSNSNVTSAMKRLGQFTVPDEPGEYRFYFWLDHRNGCYINYYLSYIDFSVKPDSPKNLTAQTGNSCGKKIDVSWDAVNGADKYEVYRSEDANSNFEKISEETGTTFNDVTALGDTLYYYRVKAVDNESDSVSEFSDTVSAHSSSVCPDPRVDVVVISNSQNGTCGSKNKLYWSPVLSSNGAAVNYEIWRANSSFFSSSFNLIYTTSELEYIDITALPGSKFDYKIRAVFTDDSYSNYSNILEDIETPSASCSTVTCGLATNTSPEVAPTQNLCADSMTMQASNVTYSSTSNSYNWTCSDKVNPNDFTQCSVVKNLCGSASNTNVRYSSPPNANLCSTGSNASQVVFTQGANPTDGTYRWNCTSATNPSLVKQCTGIYFKPVTDHDTPMCGSFASSNNATELPDDEAYYCNVGNWGRDSVETSTGFSWTCQSEPYDIGEPNEVVDVIPCSVNKPDPNVNAQCKVYQGFVSSAPSESDRCVSGTSSALTVLYMTKINSIGLYSTVPYRYSWSCKATNNSIVNCDAQALSPGLPSPYCGPANGTESVAFPSDSTLCYLPATASNKTTSNGKYNWICSTNAKDSITNENITLALSCSASTYLPPVNGACGTGPKIFTTRASALSASGTNVINNFDKLSDSSKCSAGSLYGSAESGPITQGFIPDADGIVSWNCYGSHGGEDNTCYAKLSSTDNVTPITSITSACSPDNSASAQITIRSRVDSSTYPVNHYAYNTGNNTAVNSNQPDSQNNENDEAVFIVSNLNLGTTYSYKTVANMSDGSWSNYSSIVTVRTPSQCPNNPADGPTVNISAKCTSTNSSNAQVNIKSNISASNYPLEHTVYNSSGIAIDGATDEQTGRNEDANIIITGLSAGNSYEYKVRARYSDGTYSPFTSVSVSTPGQCPSDRNTCVSGDPDCPGGGGVCVGSDCPGGGGGGNGNNKTLTVARIGQGSVVSDDNEISCDSTDEDCYEVYPKNTSVTLTATPASGYNFEEWLGDCDGTNNSCDLTMNVDKHAIAKFSCIDPEDCPDLSETELQSVPDQVLQSGQKCELKINESITNYSSNTNCNISGPGLGETDVLRDGDVWQNIFRTVTNTSVYTLTCVEGSDGTTVSTKKLTCRVVPSGVETSFVGKMIQFASDFRDTLVSSVLTALGINN